MTSPGLLALPWDRPLREWDATEVPLRDIPVGPSRHLVRFVETDGQLWALKQLPERIAAKEYAVLRELETMGLPAVRAAGLVIQPEERADDSGTHEDSAVLVTHFLSQSWQFRRLFMRLPPNRPRHRARLLDAMATLLVELHRHGVFWGDCSLANTLFSRDGQVLQAWLVDAETSEVHRQLSDGQRQYDLDILVENVAGGMMDMVARLAEQAELAGEQPPDGDSGPGAGLGAGLSAGFDDPDLDEILIEEARGVAVRYRELWDALHAEPTFNFADRYRIEGQIRQLEELGFVVDEIALQPVEGGDDQLRLKVAVGDRRFHAEYLRRVAGLDVGEGQASILLGDLRAYQGILRRQSGRDVSEADAAVGWLERVVLPGMRRAHDAVGGVGSPIQAYCDLLEVRWILSERAGSDVGDAEALEALARGGPTDSAARMAVADAPTGQLPRVTAGLLRELDATEKSTGSE
ncbi:MAG: hypothetical protein QOC67_2150 [Pseudonocardiales bacterium]|nr:hypothetical protein [Pseudonocardiales bacterium]